MSIKSENKYDINIWIHI